MVMPGYHHFQRFTPSPLSSSLHQWVLGRDGNQCRAPGCGQVHGLEVRRIDPSGRPVPENLVTICTTCRPMWDLMGRGPFESVGSNIQPHPLATSA